MSRVTSKYQVSIPRDLARALGIRPGDELIWEPAGDALRIRPAGAAAAPELSVEAKLRLFDESTARAEERAKRRNVQLPDHGDRGWRREDLYEQRLTWPRKR
jgi:AbrB family looped-hinge helix DNA binding protein